MNKQKPSTIFGMNFLKEMESVTVDGAYDPEKELWLAQGKVVANTRASVTWSPKTYHTTYPGGGYNVDSEVDPDWS